jgi:hypothetical protein
MLSPFALELASETSLSQMALQAFLSKIARAGCHADDRGLTRLIVEPPRGGLYIQKIFIWDLLMEP